VVAAQVLPGAANAATSIALQSDGDLLVGGSASTGETRAPRSTSGFVVRLLPNGRFDSSFGDSGTVTLADLPSIAQVAATTGGHILVLGGSLIRLDQDGAMDTSFGVGGAAALPMAFVAQHFVIESSGDIALIGTVTRPDGSSAAVARLTSDGQPDPSFGTNGLVVLPTPVDRSGNPLTSLSPGGLAIQPNGAIVLTVRCGPAASGPESIFTSSVLERVTASGVPDTSFGQNGQMLIGLGETVGTFDPLLTVNADILVPIMVGSGVLGQGAHIAVISPEGQELDPWHERFLEYQSVGAFVALPDGGYVLLYNLYGYTGHPQLTLSGRDINASGFEFDGRTPELGPVTLPDNASDPNSLLLAQPDGKLIMAGTTPGANGEQALFVTRLLGISRPAVIELPSQRIHRSAGTVTLRLKCSLAQTCRGNANLYLPAHHRQARLTLGSGPFSIAAGQSRSVVIRLTHNGSLRLGRHAPMRVTLTLTLADGPTRSARITVPGVR
jgi:uncharacterized delta-60 repeat protein